MKLFINQIDTRGRDIVAACFLILSFIWFSSCSYTQALSAEKFLDRVIKIQEESDSALLTLSDDLAALAGETEEVKDAVERLGEERQAIERARHHIEELQAPESTVPLKEDLLKLYQRGEQLLLELETAGRYRLEVEPLTSAYETDSNQFAGAVAAAGDIQILLEAIKQYEAAVTPAADGLRKISPPVLYRRSHERLVANLDLLRSGLAEMAAGLESEDATGTQAASDKLSAISASNEQMAAQVRADREADYKEFNGRIAELNTLMEKVRQDQQELRQKFERE